MRPGCRKAREHCERAGRARRLKLKLLLAMSLPGMTISVIEGAKRQWAASKGKQDGLGVSAGQDNAATSSLKLDVTDRRFALQVSPRLRHPSGSAEPAVGTAAACPMHVRTLRQPESALGRSFFGRPHAGPAAGHDICAALQAKQGPPLAEPHVLLAQPCCTPQGSSS